MKIRGFEIVDDKFRTHENISLPVRSTKNSAGYDFVTPVDIHIPAHSNSKLISTDIKAYMLPDELLVLHVRSSLGIKKGITLVNCTGVIDSDYYSNPNNDGNIGFSLMNKSDEDVIIKAGERVMQGIFQKFMIADDDDVTTERIGGFGSTK